MTVSIPLHEPTGEQWLGFQPRHWQTLAYPIAVQAIAEGRRGLIRAATGSGKSILQAELVATLLQQLEQNEIIVVSAPSQDLVKQLAATISKRCPGQVGLYYQHEKTLHLPIIVTCHASMHESDTFCPECHPNKWHVGTKHHEGLELAEMRGMFQALAIAENTKRCADAWGHELACTNPARLTRDLIAAELSVRFMVSDECHKTQCDQVLGFVQWMQPQDVIGFTATPWRSSEKENLELFEELLFDYGPTDAIRDGVVMMPTVVPYTGDATSVDEACLEMIQANFRVHGPSPGVVSANSIEDADNYSAFLNERGLRSSSIHSKQDKQSQQENIQALHDGDLDCLVHVNMLSEGVDFPWLEWLCMRRHASSRIRFCQEAGRVLRVKEGKKHAWIFDPNDLFGQLSLDYVAVLGGESMSLQSEVDMLAKEVEALFADLPGDNEGGTTRNFKAKALGAVQAWVRTTALGLRLSGQVESQMDSTQWRGDKPTDSQLNALASIIGHKNILSGAGLMTEAQRVVMREATLNARDGKFSRGDVFDLLCILHVMRNTGQLPCIEEVAQ